MLTAWVHSYQYAKGEVAGAIHPPLAIGSSTYSPAPPSRWFRRPFRPIHALICCPAGSEPGVNQQDQSAQATAINRKAMEDTVSDRNRVLPPTISSSASEYVELKIDRRKPHSSKSGRMRDKAGGSNPANQPGRADWLELRRSSFRQWLDRIGSRRPQRFVTLARRIEPFRKTTSGLAPRQHIAIWVMLAVAAVVVVFALAMAFVF